ncbi:hypothetical protein [Intrasporangium flavum]|uniref:hypothetical protein n=1 Tax=Intrasporangium flavum TaxID=1428657 RepID=UPI001A97B385|nr:hypothetical protein [Intrasporangium flavum]
MTGVSARPRVARRRTAGLRGLAAVVLAAAALFGTSVGAHIPPAAAASCAAPTASEVVASADVIVVGRLTHVEDPGASYSPHPVSWTVEVASVHQGQAPRLLHAETDDVTTVPEGDRYVVALQTRDGRLLVSPCALAAYGTTEADAVLAAAGPGHAPTDGAAATALPGYAPVELGSGWSPAAVGFALMGAALVLALLVAAGVGLRRARVEARARRLAMSRPAR